MASVTQKQIEAFRAVMIAGSMTGAANLLLISQPAVSRLIRDLEAETKLQLFKRRGTTLLPTQIAFAFAEEVERSFVGLNRIAAFAAELQQETKGRLRIAAVPALAHGPLSQFIVPFMSGAPGMRVSILSLPSREVIEAVSRDQADLGYTYVGLDRPGFSHHTTSLPAVVALPAGHRLAGLKLIQPNDLAGESFVMIRPGLPSAAPVELCLAGISYDVRFSVQTSYDACALIAAGAGVSIVDPMVALDYRNRGLVFLPFKPRVEAGFQSIRPKGGSGGGGSFNRAERPALLERLVREFHEYATGQVGACFDLSI